MSFSSFCGTFDLLQPQTIVEIDLFQFGSDGDDDDENDVDDNDA